MLRLSRHFKLIESMERRLHLDASQLTASIASSSLAASVSDESVLKGTIIVDVANNGTVAQKFAGVVEVLAANQVLNLPSGNYHVLASAHGLISLQAGQSKDYTLAVNLAKGKLADGTYTLYGVASGPSGVFSPPATGATLVVRPPIVALSETEAFHNLPATVAPNTKFNTTDKISITNSGSDPSADPLVINVYASTTGAISGATLLATAKRTLTIKAGGTVVVPIAIHAKAGLPAATYKLISAVTQSNQTVTTNNPATARVLNVPAPATNPQFVDTVLTASPQYTNSSSGVQTLTQIDVGMFIENNGVTSSGADQFALYVSTSSTFDSSATKVVSLPLTQTIPGAGSGNSFQVDFGIPDPSPVQFNGGNYYIYVQVTDTSGDVTLGADPTPVAIS